MAVFRRAQSICPLLAAIGRTANPRHKVAFSSSTSMGPQWSQRVYDSSLVVSPATSVSRILQRSRITVPSNIIREVYPHMSFGRVGFSNVYQHGRKSASLSQLSIPFRLDKARALPYVTFSALYDISYLSISPCLTRSAPDAQPLGSFACVAVRCASLARPVSSDAAEQHIIALYAFLAVTGICVSASSASGTSLVSPIKPMSRRSYSNQNVKASNTSSGCLKPVFAICYRAHLSGTLSTDRMTVTEFVNQVWTLTKKDLLLTVRRRWLSTFIRAVAFPIVLSVILASVKTWIHNDGGYGIGTPTAIRSLPDAFDLVGNTRKNFVIVDRGLPGDDVRSLIQDLSTLARNGGRDVQTVRNSYDLRTACPSSSKGVTNCFGAVDFWSSPGSGPGALWNYTIWQDSVIGGANVLRSDNPVQVYTLPLQRAIDSMISIRNNGTQLPDTILQYPYTFETQAQKDFEDSEFFGLLVTQALAFAFFIAMCGIAYHLTGYVVRQREEGMLQLIDAQMPNKSRWECLAARMFATHIAFDLIYMPAWIISGAVVGEIVFPHSNTGYFVLAYMLCGLAMTRQQLSALSAIVAALAFAIVAQFSQSGQSSTSTPAAVATGLLFPPSSFVYFLVSGAVAEIFSQPINLEQELPSILEDTLGVKIWHLAPAYFLGFFAFQIAVYPVLAIIIERFLWGSSFRGRHFRSTEEMDGNSVRIINFTKRYNKAFKHRDRTLAVDKLSLDLYAGSITMLLGANGCGKSSTLKTITGLESITEGRIDIDNSGGIGLCPQSNTHFGEMTVQENVWFFQQLKTPSLPRKQGLEEVKRLIHGCDLQRKINARAKSLSGGQMRKLQLCMMLAGGSKVCCIDEASSGIDPLARRKIWEILLAERGHRTMLLTTHFLDESEVLADHIAIMSKGNLRAEGTMSALKSSLGGGFRVVLPGRESSTVSTLACDNTVLRQHVNDAVFDVPDSESLSLLLVKLDQASIADYQIESPSIETIFLRLADEVRADQEKSSANEYGIGQQSLLSDTMNLHTGTGCGPMEQTWILFRKRLTILKHNFMPYIASLFVPLVVAGLVTRFFINVDSSGLQCQDPRQTFVFDDVPEPLLSYSVAESLIYGPPSEVTTDMLQRLIPNNTFCSQLYSYCFSDMYTDWSSATAVTTIDDFNAQIAASISSNGYSSGGFFLGNSSPPVFAWLADDGLRAPIFLSGTLDLALTNAPVAKSYDTFSAGYSPQDFYQSLVAVFITLGFILFPGLFALYPTRERLQKVRAMQYSNGITTGPLWVAYSLFDFCFLIMISVLVTVIFLVQGYSWYGLGYLFV
nr:atp-binding cassette sub-family a member 3 [Quercus suber]